MTPLADELEARFAAGRYLERLKRNKKLAREVMKTSVVVRNQAGYLEVAPMPTRPRFEADWANLIDRRRPGLPTLLCTPPGEGWLQ